MHSITMCSVTASARAQIAHDAVRDRDGTAHGAPTPGEVRCLCCIRDVYSNDTPTTNPINPQHFQGAPAPGEVQMPRLGQRLMTQRQAIHRP